MPTGLRKAEERDLPSLNALCMRSKAIWGYDPSFMEACRGELTLHRRDLATSIAVIEDDGVLLGTVQVDVADDEADLLKLFVEPGGLRRGFGAMLFEWAVDAGVAPSGSIPGRFLPRLTMDILRRV